MATLTDAAVLCGMVVMVPATLVCVVLGGFLAAQVLSACSFGERRHRARSATARPSVALIVPAHNEGERIEATLTSARKQIRANDRLIVVADNCSDETAARARQMGAEIVHRDSLDEIGKGYALAAGAQYVAASGAPDVVIFVDADCTLGDGALDALASEAHRLGRLVQGRYLMVCADTDPIEVRALCAFWALKNLIRPLGSYLLKIPCQIQGSGFAVPSRLLDTMQFGQSHLAEDMRMGVLSAVTGAPPQFCPEAVIVSKLAPSREGRDRQRLRWQRGHLAVIRESGLALVAAAFARRKVNLLFMALDLAIPPLSMLVALLLATLVGTFVLAVFGRPFLFCCNFGVDLVLAVSLLSGWAVYLRQGLGLKDLLMLGPLVVERLVKALSAFAGSGSVWTRSER